MEFFVGCIGVLAIIALVFGGLYVLVSAITYIICLAFGWGWSWMIGLGVCAVICLIWLVIMPLKGGKND